MYKIFLKLTLTIHLFFGYNDCSSANIIFLDNFEVNLLICGFLSSLDVCYYDPKWHTCQNCMEKTLGSLYCLEEIILNAFRRQQCLETFLFK